jgi:hypothetical protein
LDVVVVVPSCPVCGEPGEGTFYKASDPYTASQYFLEAVVNHSTNDQTRPGKEKDITRNNFCYTGWLRKAYPQEIVRTWRADPKEPPDWPLIMRDLQRRKGGKQTKIV